MRGNPLALPVVKQGGLDKSMVYKYEWRLSDKCIQLTGFQFPSVSVYKALMSLYIRHPYRKCSGDSSSVKQTQHEEKVNLSLYKCS